MSETVEETKKQPRPPIPSFLMSAEELVEMWGYKNTNVLYNAISNGRFPIPTFRHGRYLVADVEVVKLYWKKKRQSGVEAVLRD